MHTKIFIGVSYLATVLLYANKITLEPITITSATKTKKNIDGVSASVLVIDQQRIKEKADIYFTIGGNFEKAWPPRIKDQNRNMEIFDCSKRINGIAMKFNKKSKKILNKQLPSKDIHVWTIPQNIEKNGKHI